MDESILQQLSKLRELFRDAEPIDPSVINQYGWIIVKSLNKHAEELGSVQCRRLLSDILKLPLNRPSVLYSSLLSAAIKVASLYPDFHFIKFVNIWNPTVNLRPEDSQDSLSEDGLRKYSSLEERLVKNLFHSQLLYPGETMGFELSRTFGYRRPLTMIVKNVSQSEVNGRKLYFAHLASNDGIEVVAESHLLRPHPLQPSDKRHFVNVGQLYNVLLREKNDDSGVRLVEAVLSDLSLYDIFSVSVGFVDGIDEGHGHIHVFDSDSRHYVSYLQRFSKIQKGQFVEFIPIIPAQSNFKSAIILSTNKSQSELAESYPLRDIIIKSINKEKGYYVWELCDTSSPIVEQLSPMLQASAAICSFAAFGYLNFSEASSLFPSGISVDDKFRAAIFLRRSKDGKKRPHIVYVRPL